MKKMIISIDKSVVYLIIVMLLCYKCENNLSRIAKSTMHNNEIIIGGGTTTKIVYFLVGQSFINILRLRIFQASRNSNMEHIFDTRPN